MARKIYFQIILIDTAVDECSEGTDTCDAQATCTDTDDAYTCACNNGYTGDGESCSGKS